MNKIKSLTFLTVALICAAAGMTPAKASLLQLTHDPLFLNQTVPPAIAVTLDDSGSMAWAYLGNAVRDQRLVTFEDNPLYYNPDTIYNPPIRADGSQMPNINPKAAPRNGYFEYAYGDRGLVDLTKAYNPLYQFYYYANGTVGITYVNSMSGLTDNGKNTRAYYLTKVDPSLTGTPVASNYVEHKITDADELVNFANWYSYYNTRMKLARAAISRAFAGFGPSFKVDWQLLNTKEGLVGETITLDALKKFDGQHRKDFYKFLFSAPTDGNTPLRASFVRAGDLFKQAASYESDDFNTTLSCQQNFHIAISDGGWNSSFSNPAGFNQDHSSLSVLPGDTGTDSEPGAKYGGYNGLGEQKIYNHSYKRNLADIAFHYWANDLMPSLNNNVKRYKKDYKNAAGVNIDFTGLDDEWQHDAFVWNPRNNPAYWQHVVTYNVGLGLEASQVLAHQKGSPPSCSQSTNADSKQAIYEDLRKGDCSWPNSDNESRRIDDVWHSSINSRGDFFSANNPEQLVKALNAVVNDILERLSRGSASTVSSGVITNDSTAFSPGFDSSTWSGNLMAREVNSDGTFGDVKWDAACVLTGGLCSATGEIVTQQSNRNIFTYNKSTGTVPFSTSGLGTLKSALSSNANEVLSRTGASVDDLINYVRGSQNREISNGGVLRNRTSVLADIIHGSPTVVKGPAEFYDDTKWPSNSLELAAAVTGNSYFKYQTDNLNRHNVLYMGSNSGMLHAFDAENPITTQEYWGYIPSKAFNNIHRLIDPQFKHWSYVDNSPVVRDTFDGDKNKWRTTLVGGMRYGGQAYYALDVTDGPTNQPKVLWEFTDEDDADMGYSYGEATISRITSTGDWVALLPNGYNNTQSFIEDPSDTDDNHVSGSGNAVLFVVRISDGQLLAKLDTGVGSPTDPNGLAGAIAVDSQYSIPPGESMPRTDFGADFAYAGDLYGNLWRFDFTDPDPSNWSADTKRIIKADNKKHRPITVKPRVVSIPSGDSSNVLDVMVTFGTGKYLEIPDRSINLPATQYLVGVIDGLGSTREDLSIENSLFVKQTFSSTANTNLRKLSDNDVDFQNDYGWKIELPEQGERLTNPLSILSKKLMLAATTVTAGIDPCEAGGRSWLLAFDPMSGGTSDIGRIFNLENLGVYQDGDGLLINDLVVGSPTSLTTGAGVEKLIIEGAGANTGGVSVISLQSFTWRRRNWTNLLTE